MLHTYDTSSVMRNKIATPKSPVNIWCVIHMNDMIHIFFRGICILQATHQILGCFFECKNRSTRWFVIVFFIWENMRVSVAGPLPTNTKYHEKTRGIEGIYPRTTQNFVVRDSKSCRKYDGRLPKITLAKIKEE